MRLLTPKQFSDVMKLLNDELVGKTIERIFFDGETVAFSATDGVSVEMPSFYADVFTVKRYWSDENDNPWEQELFPLVGKMRRSDE